jgi:hypothetical protein
MELERLLPLMAVAYLLTVSIEAPVLLLALSRRHPLKHRLFAGFWLTACTYPILWLVLPSLINPSNNRILYLAVGETFVPIAECVLFWWAFGNTEPRSIKNTLQDMAAIVVANLFSFGWGEVFNVLVGWEWLIGS